LLEPLSLVLLSLARLSPALLSPALLNPALSCRGPSSLVLLCRGLSSPARR